MKTEHLFYLDLDMEEENYTPHPMHLAALADKLGSDISLRNYARTHKKNIFKEWNHTNDQLSCRLQPQQYDQVEALIQQQRALQVPDSLPATIASNYIYLDIADILLVATVYMEILVILFILFGFAFHR